MTNTGVVKGDMLELYLSTEEELYYVKGLYYDSDKVEHELKKRIHIGDIVDSVLLGRGSNGRLCSYYIYMDTVVFYNALYHKSEAKKAMLIHNIGQKEIKVKFDECEEIWVIKPGKNIQIPAE